MHDGASARAFLDVEVKPSGGATPHVGTVFAKTQVLTQVSVPIGPTSPPHPTVIRPSDPSRLDEEYEIARAASAAIFETVADTSVAEQLNRIDLHTWGLEDCCLPRGARRIDLVGRLAHTSTLTAAWRLRPGSVPALRGGAGPGHRADGRRQPRAPADRAAHGRGDAARRPAGRRLTRVEWGEQDALQFPLCVSAAAQGGGTITGVSVARGNLVLADHGETRVEWYPDDPGWGVPPSQLSLDPPDPGIVVGERPYSFRLGEGPLAQRVATPATDTQSAAEMLAADPREPTRR